MRRVDSVQMSAELVCVGLATLDTIVALPRWPEPDGRVVVDALVRAGGGPAATAAVAAARLGRSVAFVGRIGRDAAGAIVRQGLADAGVDITHLRDDGARTPESVILVERRAQTRSILHAPGTDLDELTPAARDACVGASWVHVDHAGWRAASALPRAHVSVDAGNPIPALDTRGLGLFAPTESAMLERYPGLDAAAAARKALTEGAQRVAVTLGSNGAVAADVSGAWRAGGVAVEAVSTLGAGDVFHGALLAMLLEGQTTAEALRAANVAAALSCRALDARSAIPTRAELSDALAAAPVAEPISPGVDG